MKKNYRCERIQKEDGPPNINFILEDGKNLVKVKKWIYFSIEDLLKDPINEFKK